MRVRLIIVTALLLPVLEIAVLVAVGQVIGIGWALLATLVGSVVGGVVIQREGRRSMRRLREMLETGQAPGADSGTGALRIVAGVALLIPGLLTDLVGLLLLTPPVRALARAWLLRSLLRQVSRQPDGPRQVKVRRGGPVPPGEGEVIEGEVVDPAPPDERSTT
jgi:UPF0716 protein FxsA